MNSLDKLSKALADYMIMVTIGTEPIQAVTKEYQEWDDIGVTQFSIFIDPIFEEVKQITAIRAKTIVDKNGNTNPDIYIITNDERSWFDLMHFEGAKKIFNVLASMSKTITAPFLYDEGEIINMYVPGSAYNTEDYVKTDIDGFNIYKCIQAVEANSEILLDNEEYWERQSSLIDTKGRVIYNISNNSNIPDSAYRGMDNNIRAALRYYVLREWYSIVGMDATSFDQQYTDEILNLRRNSYIRTKPIVRQYDARP